MMFFFPSSPIEVYASFLLCFPRRKNLLLLVGLARQSEQESDVALVREKRASETRPKTKREKGVVDDGSVLFF